MGNIEIEVPNIKEQQLTILKDGVLKGIDQLERNLSAPIIENEKDYKKPYFKDTIFSTIEEGYTPPPPELIDLWFNQFKDQYSEFNTDEKLAKLLGIYSKGADRRIRSFRKGEKEIPYGIWRRFLVITGRVPQEIYKVIGIFEI